MIKPKVLLEMTVPDFNRLTDYLVSHEEDIAVGINDFEELYKLYVLVCGDPPEYIKKFPDK